MKTIEQLTEELKGIHDELVKKALAQDTPQAQALNEFAKAAALAKQQFRDTGQVRVRLKYSDVRRMRKLSREFVQKTTISNAETTFRPARLYAPRLFVEAVQDYLRVVEMTWRDRIGETRLGSLTGAAAVTNENANKPVVEWSLTNVIRNPQKIAATGLVTTEVIASHQEYIDFIAWYIPYQVEAQLHNLLLAQLLAAAAPFTVTSQGLVRPTIIDLIEFLRRNYNYNAVVEDERPWEATGVVIPRGYYTALTIQQDNVGQRRSTDIINDLSIVPHGGTNNTYMLVFNTESIALYVLDDVIFSMNQVVDEAADRNLHRYTAELRFVVVERAGTILSVANTQTAISALQ